MTSETSAFNRSLVPIAPKKKNKPPNDLPVTFHSKVKSSGYSNPSVCCTRENFSSTSKSNNNGIMEIFAPGVVIKDVQWIHPESTGMFSCVGSDFAVSLSNGTCFLGHQSSISRVCFSASSNFHDKKTAVTSSNDQSVKIWSVSGRCIGTLRGTNADNLFTSLQDVCYLAFDRVVAVAEQDKIALFSFRFNEPVDDIQRHNRLITFKFCGSVSDKRIGHQCRRILPVDPKSVDGKLVASGSNHTILLWDLSNEVVISAYEKSHDGEIRFLGKFEESETAGGFVTSSVDNTVKIWDERRLIPVMTLQGEFKLSGGLSGRVSAKANSLFVASECGSMFEFDLRKTEGPCRKQRVSDKSLTCVDVSKKSILVGGLSNSIKLINRSR